MPSVMNGHMAAVGNSSTEKQYEHGIQVIDGDKEFRYILQARSTTRLTRSAMTYKPIYSSHIRRKPGLIII